MLERATSRFSVENFLSGSIEKFRSGTLLCFTTFLVSKKFMEKGGGGGKRLYQEFPQSLFVSAPKNFVGESFNVSLISGIEKSYA